MVRPLVGVLLASAVLLCGTAPTKHGESDAQCPLMVKILDAVKGLPAGSVALRLYRQRANTEWTLVTNGVTDVTGEIHNLISEQDFQAGVYRVEFDTKSYWKAEGFTPFHELADVVFEAHTGGHRHYTLALLLSPYSYTSTAVVVKTNE
ncbi:transthyretin [Aplochiton taeniatus]